MLIVYISLHNMQHRRSPLGVASQHTNSGTNIDKGNPREAVVDHPSRAAASMTRG